jgi:hypothetical protein
LECVETAGKTTREFCSHYNALKAELGTALRAAQIEARITELTGKLDKASSSSTSVRSEADPQAQTLSFLTGYDLHTSQGITIAIVAIMILACAGLGPYAAASMLQTPVPRQRRPSVAALIVERLLRPRMITIEGTVVSNGMPRGGTSLALPSPDAVEVAIREYPPRPPVAPEWNALLLRMGMPAERPAGPLRPQDDYQLAGLRFLAWLSANRLSGDYAADKIDDLYGEFCAADHKTPVALRIVKNRMENFKKHAWRSQPRPKTDGEPRRIMWTIKAVPLARMQELLEKSGALAPAPVPEEPRRNRVIALFSSKEANAS